VSTGLTPSPAAGTSASSVGPHLRSGALLDPPRRYTEYGEVANLATNELIHPALADLHRRAMASVDPADFRRYTTHGELIESLGRYLDLPPDQILLTAGFDDAIELITSALFTTTNRLVLQWPNFASSLRYPTLSGVEIIRVDASAADGGLSALDLALEQQPPSAVLVSNPNGPVGSCFSLEQVERLAEQCERREHLLVIDEVYVPYNGFDHLPILDRWKDVVLARSFSKSFGLAGLRLGVILASPQMTTYLSRWTPANAVSCFTAGVMRYLLDHVDEIEAIQRDVVEARADFIGTCERTCPRWQVLPSTGNFVTIDVASTTTVDTIVAELMGEAIAVKSMAAYGSPFDRWLRVGIADPDTLRRVLATLQRTHDQLVRPEASGSTR
jgi:histidinol-phosphate aminotransferase